MCGIAGVVGSQLSTSQLKHYIALACKALRHRGPDDERYYVDSLAALGACRLAIRDVQKGIQPLERQDRVLVFNGELYHTQPLKKRLMSLGYTFETEGDTEILLNSFIEYGPAVLQDLEGMFAFALWDKRRKRLYLARDRWGEKPLYYAEGEGSLVFGSEIKSLRSWPQLTWERNVEDIQLFLESSYLVAPRTGWKGIFKLEPGSMLIWEEGRISKKLYVSFDCKQECRKSPNELFDLLHQSVKDRIISDRPIGAFLSGGIDSTTVAYFLSHFQPEAPIFTLDWDDESYSEGVYVKEAAHALKLNLHSVKCDEAFFLNHFEQVVALYDEPFADESMIPTYCLAKFAKSKVDVVLTGDGSDEFFYGYEKYFFNGDFKKYIDTFAAAPRASYELVCEPDFIALKPQNPLLSYAMSQNLDLLDKRTNSLVDIKTYLPDDILMKVDRATMGVGLEARAPFLSPQITQFALSCQTHDLIGQGKQGKKVLREAMKDHLPQTILRRKKMGFGVPFNEWFRSSLKDWLMKRLFEGSLLKTGWFSTSGLQSLILNHMKRKENHARFLLNLLVLEIWLNRYK